MTTIFAPGLMLKVSVSSYIQEGLDVDTLDDERNE